MANKLKGASSAVGYWGRNIFKRIDNEQIPQKIRVLLQDKILSRGKNVFLWTEVTDNTPGSLDCSCVKDTSDRADITCHSCYGTQFIPGYIRFLHETLLLPSISTTATLTNVSLNTDIKPHRILLNDLQLSGSIESAVIPYSNPFDLDWDFRLDGPNILDTNTIDAEFSTDGTNFFPISEINDSGKKPTGSGNIFLRVNMTRASVSDRSPEFEILRVRHPSNNKPFIKILRPQIQQIPTLMNYGKRVEHMAERFWTVPLDFFDSSLDKDTPEAKIQENSFYERADGIHSDLRYVTTRPMYNEEFGIFTLQSFEARRTQPEEVYTKLVF